MYILLDIGGTNTRISSTSDLKTFVSPIKFNTVPDLNDEIKQIKHQLAKLDQSTNLAGAIIAMPGSILSESGRLTSAPNLPSWENLKVTDQFEQALNTKVWIFNDADLGGLGEAVYGAGQRFNSIAYLTISTGIGGTRIVDRKIDQGLLSLEPGHQIIDIDASLEPDTTPPTSLEHLIGGASLAIRFQVPPQDIDDQSVWIETAHRLAIGLYNVTVFWSPECIILGGPMMNDIDINLVDKSLQKLLPNNQPRPNVFPAALDDDRAFYGALAFLSTKNLPTSQSNTDNPADNKQY